MEFDEVIKMVLDFRDKRDWKKFHNPKDLAISLNLEAAELLEIFQWSGKDLDVKNSKNKVKEELADILIYCIYMAKAYDLNIYEIIFEKIAINNIKYPIEKAKGNSTKYTEL